MSLTKPIYSQELEDDNIFLGPNDNYFTSELKDIIMKDLISTKPNSGVNLVERMIEAAKTIPGIPPFNFPYEEIFIPMNKKPHKCTCPRENFTWAGKNCVCGGI